MARVSNTGAVGLLFLAAAVAVGANPDTSVSDNDASNVVKALDIDVERKINVDAHTTLGGMALKPSDKDMKAGRNIKEIQQETNEENARTSNDSSGRINKKKGRSRHNMKKVKRILKSGESFQSSFAATFVENSVSDSSTMTLRSGASSNTGWHYPWHDPSGWYGINSKSSKVSKVGSDVGDDWYSYYDDWVADSWYGDDSVAWSGKSDKTSTDDNWQGDDYYSDWWQGNGYHSDWDTGSNDHGLSGKSDKDSTDDWWPGDDYYHDWWQGDDYYHDWWQGDDYYHDWNAGWNDDNNLSGKSDKESTDDWWQGDDYHDDWDSGWGNRNNGWSKGHDQDRGNGWSKGNDHDRDNGWRKGNDWGSWGNDRDRSNGWGKNKRRGNGGGNLGGKWNDEKNHPTFTPTLSPTMSPTFYPTFYPTISPTYTVSL